MALSEEVGEVFHHMVTAVVTEVDTCPGEIFGEVEEGSVEDFVEAIAVVVSAEVVEALEVVSVEDMMGDVVGVTAEVEDLVVVVVTTRGEVEEDMEMVTTTLVDPTTRMKADTRRVTIMKKCMMAHTKNHMTNHTTNLMKNLTKNLMINMKSLMTNPMISHMRASLMIRERMGTLVTPSPTNTAVGAGIPVAVLEVVAPLGKDTAHLDGTTTHGAARQFKGLLITDLPLLTSDLTGIISLASGKSLITITLFL